MEIFTVLGLLLAIFSGEIVIALVSKFISDTFFSYEDLVALFLLAAGNAIILTFIVVDAAKII